MSASSHRSHDQTKMTIKSVFRGSLSLLARRRSLGPPSATQCGAAARSTAFPVAFSPLCRRCCRICAIITIVHKPAYHHRPKHPPPSPSYNSLLGLSHPSAKDSRTCENPHPARAATRATPPCALRLPSTHGSALTPTALPILLKPRLLATDYEGVLELTLKNPRFRAGTSLRTSLWTCSPANKSTYSQQARRRRATSPRARRQTGQSWKESAPGMVIRCPAG